MHKQATLSISILALSGCSAMYGGVGFTGSSRPLLGTASERVTDGRLASEHWTEQSRGQSTTKSPLAAQMIAGLPLTEHFDIEGAATLRMNPQRGTTLGTLTDETGATWNYRGQISLEEYPLSLSLRTHWNVSRWNDVEWFARLGVSYASSSFETSIECESNCPLLPIGTSVPTVDPVSGAISYSPSTSTTPDIKYRGGKYSGSSYSPAFGLGVSWKALRLEYGARRAPIRGEVDDLYRRHAPGSLQAGNGIEHSLSLQLILASGGFE